MYFIRTRRLHIACGIFLVFLFIGAFVSNIFRIILLCASAIMFITALIIYIIAEFRHAYSSNKGTIAFIISALFSASLISFLYFGIHTGRVAELAGSEHTITAVVKEVENQTVYNSEYLIEVLTADGEPLKFKARLETSFASELEVLDIIRFRDELSEFSDNFAGFNEHAYNFSKGVLLYIETDKTPEIIGRAQTGPRDITGKLNVYLRNLIYYNITDKDTAGFVSGILLGNRYDVAAELKRDFRCLGLSHILALSGLHLSILNSSLELMLKRLYVNKKLRLIFQSVFIVIYMMLTGFQPSVIRGGLMFIMSSLVWLLGFQYDPITALLYAVCAICIISPESITDIGLIMSFLATLGILTLGDRMQRKLYKKLDIRNREGNIKRLFGIIGKCAEQLIMTFSALLFTFPVSLIYFGEFSLAGIIATPLAAPILSIIISAAALMVILSPIKPAAHVLSLIITLMYRFMADMSKYAAKPEMLISLRHGYLGVTVMIFAVIMTVLLIRRKKPMLSLFISLSICTVVLTICAAFTSAVNSVSVSAAYVNYRKNDMIVLNSGGMGLICDISDGSKRPLSEAEYVLNEEFGNYRIDAYMLTHFHRRHIGTLIKFAQSSYIDKLLMPYPENESDSAVSLSLAEAADDYGIEVVYYSAGEAFEFGISELTLCKDSTVGYSDHPITALAITTQNAGIIYAGSSAYNSRAFGFCERFADNCGSVILGMHGPKQKFAVAASSCENVRQICAAYTDMLPISGFVNAERTVLEYDGSSAYRVFIIE